MLFLLINLKNAQVISTHSRLTTSLCNRRNACALCADALVTDWLYFSEVVIGSVEPTKVRDFCKSRCKISEKYAM